MKMRSVVMVFFLCFVGAGALGTYRYINTQEEPEQDVTKVTVSGDGKFIADILRIKTRSTSPELASVFSPKCGPAKPEHAPEECGVQQWKGYSETNPAASAWLALANTGTESCSVTITQLVLSYLPTATDQNTPTRVVLSSNIQGAQMLTDGTLGEAWGMYLRDLPPGSTFAIPANTHAYVHPFGPIVGVPNDATEVTVTYSAEITNGCAVSGGINTFEENTLPNTNPPYTQNGSETDFIKEAIKTPWVTKTIDAKEPISYSIKRLPRDQRTGWQKETVEASQE